MIVATAGHVDHGKTQLVKALTGVDTDTLTEEKERGLTINIGFAYLPVTEQETVGFIDVPGHDRFIKNAICGLAATDFVLLVIAADDGVMPQTEEHLAIIDLLGIHRAAIVVTKIDRVSPERITEVEVQIAKLLQGTTLQAAPLLRISALKGIGVETLRDHLTKQLVSYPEKRPVSRPINNFRLAVDRTFRVKGVGLVVTGTIFSGRVSIDDSVIVAGTDMKLRVRGLHAQNARATHGYQGQRCALNLAGPGLRKELIQRGDWIGSFQMPAPVTRFDARLHVLKQSPRPLAHWAPVHLHLAATELTARVAVLSGKNIKPGESGLVQIVTSNSIATVFADRFIIRDQSARITLGGGQVLDIFPPKRGRAAPTRISWLEHNDCNDAAVTLKDLLKLRPDGVNLDQFFTNRNLAPEEIHTVSSAINMTTIDAETGKVGFFPTHWKENCSNIMSALENAHQTSPEHFGLSLSQLLKSSKSGLPVRQFKSIVDEMVRQSLITTGPDGYVLEAQQSRMSTADFELWEKIDRQFCKSGLRPVTIAEIAQTTNLDQRTVKALLSNASRTGQVIKLSPDLVIRAEVFSKIYKLLNRLTVQSSDGNFTVAEFRDASSIGRNHCITLLEFLDKRRITAREGTGRRLLPNADKAFTALLATKWKGSHPGGAPGLQNQGGA